MKALKALLIIGTVAATLPAYAGVVNPRPTLSDANDDCYTDCALNYKNNPDLYQRCRAYCYSKYGNPE